MVGEVAGKLVSTGTDLVRWICRSIHKNIEPDSTAAVRDWN